jgi:GDP-mannose transporter
MSEPEIHRRSSTGLSNNPMLSIIAYCASSIFMTLINKYVVSGSDFNLNFFLLFVQVSRYLGINLEEECSTK